jgi:hypothetical protein
MTAGRSFAPAGPEPSYRFEHSNIAAPRNGMKYDRRRKE